MSDLLLNKLQIIQKGVIFGKLIKKEWPHDLLETPLHIQKSIQGKYNYFVHIKCPQEQHADSNSHFGLLYKNTNSSADYLA